MGMTETAAQMLSNPLPPAPRKTGSPGIAMGNQVAILRSDLSEAGDNEQGEIAIRGPNVMKEYLKNPDATRASFTPDGWLLSGDLGHRDEDGYVFVTGRLKELIIKGGENIAPREVDEALYAHADVVEAAAFAQPCATYGEPDTLPLVEDLPRGSTQRPLGKNSEEKIGRYDVGRDDRRLKSLRRSVKKDAIFRQALKAGLEHGIIGLGSVRLCQMLCQFGKLAIAFRHGQTRESTGREDAPQ